MHSPPYIDRVILHEEALAVGACMEAFMQRQTDECGAIVHFLGRTRQDTSAPADAPTTLLALELEHYPGMTEQQLARMLAQAAEQFAFLDAEIHHRVGRVGVAEPIVLVQVAGRHRKEAIQAVDFLMDWLKTDAPFWKSEYLSDGQRMWTPAKSQDQQNRENWQR